MCKRKFYRTTFEVVVLSEKKLESGVNLDDLAQQCYDGDWIGTLHEKSAEELSSKETAQLADQALPIPPGIGAEFFNLTSDGEEI